MSVDSNKKPSVNNQKLQQSHEGNDPTYYTEKIVKKMRNNQQNQSNTNTQPKTTQTTTKK